MKIITAKTAGYCGGIVRAVKIVEDALARGEKLHTLGPLMHNPQMMAALEARGVAVIDAPEQALPGYTVVLRAHGVPAATMRRLEELGVPWLDATCPHVKKVHDIVREAGKRGDTILLLGDASHPEVLGTIGHAKDDIFVVRDAAELSNFYHSGMYSVQKSYILVSQTTSKLPEWQKCVEFTKKVWTNIALFGTICNATELRQNEAIALARAVDAMVVAGGRESSNTRALAQVCSGLCPTVLVETAAELNARDFNGYHTVGITAGASTPAFILKEVQNTMSEMTSVQDEMSFEEMLEQSLKTVSSREKVSAVVTSVTPGEIAVDIGTKHAGYVPLHEFTDDPGAKLEELVKVGDKLDLLVLRVNDVEGTAMLSKKRLDAAAGFEKVMAAEESQEVLEGVVVDVIKGGLIVLSSGVRVFIPASQATAARGQDLESMLKTNVRFRIIETNKQRRRAVGTIRAVLKEERKSLEEGFWNTVEVGKIYNGTVKSLTSYGAFVDLGGVDGMVHISELSWNRIKDPSEVVKVGDRLEVFVKDIDREAHKISLGYKKDTENPWTLLTQQYQAGDVAKVKVVSMTPFGVFAQIIPGVDGLIHISQISNTRVGKPSDVLAIGDVVEAQITDIDLDRRRVSLSIRALLADEPEQEYAEDDAPAVMEFGPPEK